MDLLNLIAFLAVAILIVIGLVFAVKSRLNFYKLKEPTLGNNSDASKLNLLPSETVLLYLPNTNMRSRSTGFVSGGVRGGHGASKSVPLIATNKRILVPALTLSFRGIKKDNFEKAVSYWYNKDLAKQAVDKKLNTELSPQSIKISYNWALPVTLKIEIATPESAKLGEIINANKQTTN